MKKHSFALFLTLIIFSFTGCNKNQERILTFTNYSKDINIHYVNNNEENILDKNSVIEIFYDDGGAMYKVDRPHLDFPNGYNLIYNDEAEDTILKLFTSDFFTVRDQRIYSKTYVKLGDYSMDTFTCQLYADAGTISVVKVWHNDNLVWEVGEILYDSPRTIKIVK